jgi:hypothetical protein
MARCQAQWCQTTWARQHCEHTGPAGECTKGCTALDSMPLHKQQELCSMSSCDCMHPLRCRVQPASAYTGEGINEGLQWLIQEIKRSQRAALLRQRAMT